MAVMCSAMARREIFELLTIKYNNYGYTRIQKTNPQRLQN